MIANYVKASLRFQAKHKTFSLINITGLALGTLCCLYILLYVMDQFSYDSHHKDAAHIYRVTCLYNIRTKGTQERIATTAAPLGPLLKKDYGEVLQYTRVVPFPGIDQHLLTYNGKTLYERSAFYVDATFFDVFSYHFIAGNPATALSEPNSVVLLQSTATKLFGKEDPIGKTYYMENAFDSKIPYTVKGIVDESLGKSHLHANIFITMNSGGSGTYMYTTDAWTANTYASTYVKLRTDADVVALEHKLPAFINHYAGEQLRNGGVEEELHLQPVTSVHTTPGYMGILLSQPVDAMLLRVLAIIAVMIQLIACINFMNLSTARASHRAREVGVRKVLGAGRGELLQQFLGESFAFTFLSVLIAVPLLVMALPWLNELTRSEVSLSLLKSWKAVSLLAGVVVLTALLSGSYPALYLSAFQAVRIMKGNFTNSVSASGIRRALVVFQFTLSIVLISGIVVIYAQLNYIKNKDLGFAKEQRLVFQLYSPETIAKVPVFINSLSQLAEVRAVSNASSYLSSGAYYYNSFYLHGQKESEQKGTSFIISDEHFVKANGIRLLNGRDFLHTDSSKVLVNEAFVKMMGLTVQTAVGTVLYDTQNRQAEIVGVMKDFHYGPLRDRVDGFVLWKQAVQVNPWPMLTVSVSTNNYKSLLATIGAIWKRDIPGAPFAYTFLDDQVAKQYETERTTTRIIDSFTLMAIFISCMGLFGLAAFSAEQRRKEISIRKVLGASVGSITQLLSMDFLKLVLVAFLIAAPVAWWLMRQWLQGFAYSVPLQWWMFAMAGGMSLLIAVLTVSFQSIKAALINPVRSLRSE